MEQTPPKEEVDHPAHYNSHPSGIEAIQIVEHLSFNLGSAFKYLYRRDHKNDDPITDLKKAGWYLDAELRRYDRHNCERSIPSPNAAVSVEEIAVRHRLMVDLRRVCSHEPANMAAAMTGIISAATGAPRDGLYSDRNAIMYLREARASVESEITRVRLLQTQGFNLNVSTPDTTLNYLRKLMGNARFKCRVCGASPRVSKTDERIFIVACDTCNVSVESEDTGIAFERWVTLLAKQNPKPVAQRVADAQLKAEHQTPLPDPK